jgi:acyl-CoA thioesterase
MARFLEATDVTREGAIYAGVIDPDWFIWGPFGGYLAAMTMRAMGKRSPHPRPATFSCQYLNTGHAGPIQIELYERRASRRANCIHARMAQDGKPLLEAQSWFVAGELEGLHHQHSGMPHVAQVAKLAAFLEPESDGPTSPIWQHIERRPTGRFAALDQTRPQARWSCWYRLCQDIPNQDLVLQAARAVLLFDLAPWPAALAVHQGGKMAHIAPTLDLTVQFQTELQSAANWLLIETESPTAGRGLYGAHGALWSEIGNLVAFGTNQGICIAVPEYEAPRIHANGPAVGRR